MTTNDDTQIHRWPEAEQSQRVKPKLSRYQRAVRWLQGAFAIAGVGGSFANPSREQDPVRNVMGIGLSTDISNEANSDHERED